MMSPSGQSTVGACPFHAATAAPVPGQSVRPNDELVFVKRRRIVREHVKTEEGTELRLFYGTKEIVFEDADLFPFGENLGADERFVAESATRWRDGAPYAWETIAPLLDYLLEEGILAFAAHAAPAPRAGGTVASPLAPAPSSTPRTWSAADDQTSALMRDLVGRSIELGHLEAILPSYRVAHPALDRDGRQVGEANVFPKALRIEVPTEWRPCQYAGSRFQDEMPFNATALKAMIKHWHPILATLVAIRSEWVKRFPSVEQGWTVGDLHGFSAVVLSVVGHALVRGEDPIANGELSPVLSSLYRLTDGVRMVTHNMLVPSEESLPHDTVLTRDDLFMYAERNNSFLSEYGVCAGPKTFIDNFFRAIFDGECQADAEAVVLSDLPAAVDYGLLGLLLQGTTYPLWIAMARAYEELANIVRDHTDETNVRFTRFQARVDAEMARVMLASLGTDADRAMNERCYQQMREQAELGLQISFEAPRTLEDGEITDRTIAAALSRIDWLPVDRQAGIARLLSSFLWEERNTLRRVESITRRLNDLLGRPQPARSLEGSDLAAYWRLRADEVGTVTYLLDLIDDELGLRPSA
jgi:hypothetical protein